MTQIATLEDETRFDLISMEYAFHHLEPRYSDDVPVVVLNSSQTMTALAWKPRYGFRDRRMLCWCDTHGVAVIYSHLKTPAGAEVAPEAITL
jgi:hypothetical protein